MTEPFKTERTAPLIFLVAGEPSGDALGATLMNALNNLTGNSVRFAGVGGPAMTAKGLNSLFPMSDLTVMGIVEIVPQLPRLIRRLNQTVAAAKLLRPAAVITIDSPDFSFRVAERLQGCGIPLVHYVAPAVWAWKPKRARKVSKFLDHMLTLLPFEPPLFQAYGLATTFVGHPAVERAFQESDGDAFRQRHGIAPDAPLICVLPGSRKSETSRLLPIFGQTLAFLAEKHPSIRVVVPTLDTVANDVRAAVDKWTVPSIVVTGNEEKMTAFAAANAALAASGTVSLELAGAGVPMVIAYRMNPLTAAIARRLIKIKFACLINIILDREAIPEFLQDACRPELLATAIHELLSNEAARQEQLDATLPALKDLGYEDEAPSIRAAKAVLAVVEKRSG